MRGKTNAQPAGGGLRVIASGTAEGGQTVTFPEPVKIVFVSRDNNGGNWVQGGYDTVPLIVFAPAKAMANITEGHKVFRVVSGRANYALCGLGQNRRHIWIHCLRLNLGRRRMRGRTNAGGGGAETVTVTISARYQLFRVCYTDGGSEVQVMNVTTSNVVIHPLKNSLLCIDGQELSTSGDVEYVDIQGTLRNYLFFVHGDGGVSD